MEQHLSHRTCPLFLLHAVQSKPTILIGYADKQINLFTLVGLVKFPFIVMSAYKALVMAKAELE